MLITKDYLTNMQYKLARFTMYNEVTDEVMRLAAYHEQDNAEIKAHKDKMLTLKEHMSALVEMEYERLVIEMENKKTEVMDDIIEYLNYLQEFGVDVIEEGLQDEAVKRELRTLNAMLMEYMGTVNN